MDTDRPLNSPYSVPHVNAGHVQGGSEMTVWIGKDLKSEITTQASQLGMSRSEWVRQAIRKALEEQR